MKVAWHKAHRGIRFNRYMVECEYACGYSHSRIKSVLIDTWWNVNAEDCHTLILTDTVLIDTWWNVNVWKSESSSSTSSSFNRYMVECEYLCRRHNHNFF